MRLQQLALRVHGDGQRLRFHDRLTVISGIDVADRQGVVEVIVGTLAGEATVSSELAYVARAGQRVTVDQTAEGTFHTFHDDGTPAVPPNLLFGLSVQELFTLMYVDGVQLGIFQQGPSEPKELADARAALAALTDQLGAAVMARDAARSLGQALRAIDVQMAQVEVGRPKRRYARMVLDLHRLENERAALLAAPQDARADEVLVRHLGALRPMAAQWRDTARKLSDARKAFGDRARLDPDTLAGALNIPDRPPHDLDALVENLAAAEAQRATLSARLAGMMAAHLESPSHPDVARLARADQAHLWKVGQRAIEVGRRLEQESMALGGLGPEGETPAMAREIESAHRAVEHAQEVVDERKRTAVGAGVSAALGAAAVPLAPFVAPLALAGGAAAAYWAVLGPRQQLADAQDWETETLIRAGVPSYLSFHLRRMQALNDPTLRAGLDKASHEHRRVMTEWRLLAGDISPVEAAKLKDEVRAYAASVAALDGLGDDLTKARRRLTEEIEPSVEAARTALIESCRPFGVEHATLAADLVRQLAEVARVARLQAALQAAEADELEARNALQSALSRLGFVTGPVEERVSAFEHDANLAEQRVHDRMVGRSVPEMSAEIERLDELVESEYRPEFGRSFTEADAKEPDPEELQARRDMTATAFYMASQIAPDVARIADRKSALERRVAVLEEQYGELGVPSPRKIAEIERHLQERLANLRHCGVGGESLPLLLDECFVHLRADVKWSMLDLIDRLAAHAQVVYLTNDAEVATWGRRRAATGGVGFLDPLRRAVAY